MTFVDPLQPPQPPQPPQPSGDEPADAPPELSVETGWTRDGATLWVSGEVDLVTAPRLVEALTDFSSTSSDRLVVDLSRLTFMSADGLAALVNTHSQLLAEGREGLMVVGASGITKRLFEITGISFPLRPDQSCAVTEDAGAIRHQGLDLQGACEAAELSVSDLFVAYFALGGSAGFAELKAFLAGQTSALDAHQRDVAAHAVNERLIDLGSQERMLAYSSQRTALRAG